jgi:hypothetical protein
MKKVFVNMNAKQIRAFNDLQQTYQTSEFSENGLENCDRDEIEEYFQEQGIEVIFDEQ